MAYGLLQEAAKKRTEYLVIEAGVDTENIIQGELPPELISILQRSFNSEDDQDRSENVRSRHAKLSLFIHSVYRCL